MNKFKSVLHNLLYYAMNYWRNNVKERSIKLSTRIDIRLWVSSFCKNFFSSSQNLQVLDFQNQSVYFETLDIYITMLFQYTLQNDYFLHRLLKFSSHPTLRVQTVNILFKIVHHSVYTVTFFNFQGILKCNSKNTHRSYFESGNFIL